MLPPLVRLVSSRIRSLNRSTAFGAIRRFGMPALVKLNPRNFLAHGRATALFCWFILSLSFAVMNRVRLSIRQCCKNDWGTERLRSCGGRESDGLKAEGLIDEQDQPNHIPLRQPAHLALPYHVHDFVALDRPPGSVKRPESLTGADPPLNCPVVLLDDVVQVWTCPTATPPAQSPLSLQLRNHLRVRWVAVHVNDPGPRVGGSMQRFLEEALGRSRVTASGQQEIDRRSGGIHGSV